MEYKFLRLDSDAVEEVLNGYASQGWVVHTFAATPDRDVFKILLQRSTMGRF